MDEAMTAKLGQTVEQLGQRIGKYLSRGLGEQNTKASLRRGGMECRGEDDRGHREWSYPLGFSEG